MSIEQAIEELVEELVEDAVEREIGNIDFANIIDTRSIEEETEELRDQVADLHEEVAELKRQLAELKPVLTIVQAFAKLVAPPTPTPSAAPTTEVTVTG